MKMENALDFSSDTFNDSLISSFLRNDLMIFKVFKQTI